MPPEVGSVLEIVIDGLDLPAVEEATRRGVRAAAEFTVHGKYLATAEGLPAANGQSYTLPAGIFFEIDDGLISRVTTYYNLQDWIAQVSKEG